MRMRPALGPRRLAPLALALALASPAAHASGLLVARFGGEHGHPTTYNLTAMYYNPAGLSLLGGTRLMLDGTLAWRSFSYTRDPNAIDHVLSDAGVGSGTPAGAGVEANSGEASLFNVLGNPFIGLATDFGVEGLGVGLSFYVPIGGMTSFDKVDGDPDYPGSVDGPARWWTIEGTLRAMYITAAASYRVKPLRLSVGAGVNVVLSSMDTVRARNSDGTDHLVSNGGLLEGRALIEVDGVDVSLSAGLIWEPIDHLYIGVSYQSQPGFGTTRMTGDTTLVLGAGPVDEVTPTPSEFYNAWPDVIRAGVRYGEPQCWEVRLSAELARWSKLYEQCLLNTDIANRSCRGNPPPGKIVLIPRRWEDAFGVRLGGSWWASPGAELLLGAGYDGNAVPDSTIDPALYDNEKFTVALGGRFALTDQLHLSVTYTQVIYPERAVEPRGREAGATMGDIGALGFAESERHPDAAGTYKQAIGVLDVSVEATF